jgi:2-dehydro-3-deoxygluconokinase
MDLVTFGEGLIRLTPSNQQLAAHVGGSELNVAVAAARLGVSSRWVSRLPDNAAGRFIDGVARVNGVDTRIDWASEGRVGSYFLEAGHAPRQSSVVYDRAGSAFSTIAPGSVDWDSALRDARWLHVSGITPALSDGAAAVTTEVLHAASRHRLHVSFDVNYRVKLWDKARARTVLEPLLESVALLVVSEEDAGLVFGATGDPVTIARALAGRYSIENVAVTSRDAARDLGAVVIARGAAFVGRRFDVPVVERVGTGDAFTAALIASRLQGRSWDDAITIATATAALKLTMPGDMFVGRRSDVDRLVELAHARAVQ